MADSSGRRALRADPVILVAIVVVLIAGAVVANVVLNSHHAAWNSGCGDDGVNYCNMVLGEPAARPWSRRVLMPLAVRALYDSSPAGIPATFLRLNIVALGVMAMGAAVLTWRMASRAGVSGRRLRAATALAGSLIVIMPMGFSWSWFYPVLTDNFAAMFAVLWLAAATAASPGLRWASVPVALCAVVSRESWAPALLAAVIVQVALPGRRARLPLAGATAAAVVVGAFIAYTAPGRPNPVTDPVFSYMFSYLGRYLGSVAGAQHFTWMALFCFGVLPLLLVRRPRATRDLVADDARSKHPIVAPAAALFFVNLAMALVGGADVHRFLFSTAPFMVPVIVTLAVREHLEAELGIVLATSLVVWRSWHVLDGTRESYFSFFSPIYVSDRATATRLGFDLAVVAGGLVMWSMWRVLQTRRAARRRGAGVATKLVA